MEGLEVIGRGEGELGVGGEQPSLNEVTLQLGIGFKVR